MMFNFILNQRTFLALARADVGPILQALAETPAIPETCQWATFLRNHDEVDLGRLVGHEHDEVFAAFGPEPDMQLYGRGIRRRLAPMLGNDHRRIEMAYALQFCLPGTPVIRYGDEIGMGEDLDLPERDAIRTPMQWSGAANGGFSTCRRKRDLRRPVITGGEFGYETVNVEDQQRDPESLLVWFQRALLILRECPEFGAGTCTYVDTGDRAVLALRHEAPSGAMLALTNLADRRRTVSLGSAACDDSGDGDVVEVFSDQAYDALDGCPRPDRARPLRLPLDPVAAQHRQAGRLGDTALIAARARDRHRSGVEAAPRRAGTPLVMSRRGAAVGDGDHRQIAVAAHIGLTLLDGTPDERAGERPG